MEEWKDIVGYEGSYKVSNLGNIKSFRQWKRAHCPAEYILKHATNNRGYHQVFLYARDGTRRKYLVHRLVAQAFIPNPNNLPHINHIDENINNNAASNLEWCTPQYNNCYGTGRFRRMLTAGYAVEQRLINGQLLATYTTISIAEDITGISKKEISACVRGCLKSAGGFIWTKA